MPHQPSSPGTLNSYCAAGRGSFRIGYPTRRLRRSLSSATRKRIRSRAVLALTSSRRYRVRGLTPGARVTKLRRALKGERRIRQGRNTWYLARGRSVTLAYKTRRGKVLAVGIADRRLTGSRRAQRRFLRAWQL